MQVKIGRKVYDTEKATEVGRHTVSFFGDPSGFEEILYKKDKTSFFLHVNGGESSKHPEEKLLVLSLEEAREWLVQITGEENALRLLPLVKEESKLPEKKSSTASKERARATKTEESTSKTKKVSKSTKK